MVKYTHKTLAGQGNGLYRDPENYLTSLGLTQKNASNSSSLAFVRKEGDLVVFANNLKYYDKYTGRGARLIGFEGNPDSIRQFIDGLEGLVVPFDAVLN
jgi:hypothetical protein